MAWISTTAASMRIGVSRATVARWAFDGKLRGRKILGQWDIDADSAEALARARAREVYSGDLADLVDCPTAAGILNRDTSTMRRYAREKRLPAWYVDGVWHFERAPLEAMAAG